MTATIQVLGDTHLGRTFTKGVRLDRRGERERLLFTDFKAALQVGRACRMHVHMGDLFDKPQVSYMTLLQAACAYRDAASNHPNCTFYILQGNHDDSRDLDEVTAWDVFQGLVWQHNNIECVTDPKYAIDGSILLPWDPTRTAVEQLARLRPEHGVDYHTESGFGTAYGHWDTDVRFGGHNLIPTAELAARGITQAYTGHIHKPDTFVRDGVEVTIVGSMQPLAQGEDGGQCSHVRYWTYTLAEWERQLDLGMESEPFKDDCIRLQLQPGEEWDGVIPDCRSWDVHRLRPDQVAAPADVSTEGFDPTAAYNKAMDGRTIIPAVREKLDQQWASISTSED